MAIQNDTDIQLSPNQVKAVALVAAGDMTNEQIADAVGVKRDTIQRWKRDLGFQAEVERLLVSIEAAIMREGIARKAQRIRRYADRLERLDRVIEERSLEMSGVDYQGIPEIPGGESGLIVRQIKSIGVGTQNREVEQFAVDTGLLREIRELEKQAAQELGQWTEQHDHTTGGEPVRFTIQIDNAHDGNA